jgi:Ca-activated chloride channel homolog
MKRPLLSWTYGACWAADLLLVILQARILPIQPFHGTPSTREYRAQTVPAQQTGSPSTSQRMPQHEPRIRVETNLVNILTNVLDKNRRPVTDLPKEAFQLYEEGVPQKIERFEAETNQPLDLALMLDTSLSATKELKFEGEAAAHFIRQVVRPGDRLALFEFSDNVTQLAEFTDQVPILQAAARRLNPGAGTSLYDAVALGGLALEKRPEGRRRVVVVVTDAGETTSALKFEDTRRQAIASEALLYSIIIRPIKSESGRNTAGEHALETITDSTGGALFYIDELDQLDATYEQIDRELRTQYLLGYYPQPTPPPGVYRHVEVKMNGAYTLRYRKGYFAGGARR